MVNKYEFTLKREDGEFSVRGYRQEDSVVSNTPVGNKADEVLARCKDISRHLCSQKIKFTLEVE